MEAKKQSNFSVLMFPWLAHGHVFPYLELGKNMSNKNFHVYFCSTAVNLDSVKNALEQSSFSFIQLVELHLPSLPDLPPQFQTTKNVPPNLMPRLFQAFQMSRSNFSDILSNLKPDLLIYDVFQSWAAELASSLSIPAVHFATTGAAAYSFAYHRFTSKNSAFPYHQAIYLKDYERKALQAEIVSDEKDTQDFAFGHFKLSNDVVLMKTCRGIEGKYIDYLSVLCQKKVVPVGPLITQSKTEENHSKIMEWLSKKDQFSTLFISFGSENYLSKDQLQEIAKGLELCDVNFIWVVRSPTGETVDIQEIMPNGFLGRVKEKGMILQGWAPQAKILAHKSVVAFMSHCGMSSTIESFYFGIPVIAVPLKLDQPLNARLLVESGIGVEVARNEDGNLKREEVAIAINKVLGKSGEGIRVRAAELRQIIKKEEENAMDAATQQLWQICMKHNQQNI